MECGQCFPSQLFVVQVHAQSICDEGLTLETSAFKLFTEVNLRFQLSC